MSTPRYTAEELQQATAQGPLTAEYQADPQHVIAELSRLRSAEIASYLQYQQHAYMAVSLLAPGLKNQFTAHAATELAHADRLGERIHQLGGVPAFEPAEIAAQAAEAGTHPEQGATLVLMVGEDLVMERRQVAAYTALIRALGDKDPTTRHILTGILAEKEKHVRELADYLKLTAQQRQ
jgi:bacterioferritin